MCASVHTRPCSLNLPTKHPARDASPACPERSRRERAQRVAPFASRVLLRDEGPLFQASSTSNPFPFSHLRTLLRCSKSQLLSFQCLSHSLHKSPGGRCPFSCFVLATRHSPLATVPSVPLQPPSHGATMQKYWETTPLPPVSKKEERTPGSASARRRNRQAVDPRWGCGKTQVEFVVAGL